MATPILGTQVLLDTNDFSTANWTRTTAAVAQNETDPDSTPNNAWTVSSDPTFLPGVVDQEVAVTGGSTHVVKLRLKQGDADGCNINMTYSAGSADVATNLHFEFTGNTLEQDAGTATLYDVTDLGSGWFEVLFRLTDTEGDNTTLTVDFTASYAADADFTTSTIYFKVEAFEWEGDEAEGGGGSAAARPFNFVSKSTEYK